MKSTLVSIYQKTAFNQNYYFPLALHYLKAYANKELGDGVAVAVKNYSIDKLTGLKGKNITAYNNMFNIRKPYL